ncbi:MAG: BrnT family toxin, partial [Bacteroidota bacterium]
MLPIRFSIVEAEVRQVFRNKPRIRKVEKGDVKNEDLYSALGQTDSGRYLIIYFIYKLSQDALVISS